MSNLNIDLLHQWNQHEKSLLNFLENLTDDDLIYQSFSLLIEGKQSSQNYLQNPNYETEYQFSVHLTATLKFIQKISMHNSIS